MTFAPGDRVGPYEVLSPLGSGGMGDVYLARDPRLERRVALKVLRPRAGTGDTDRRRVLREGRAVARIHHPRVAAVHDVVDTEDLPVLVLEYIEGRTLRRLMEAGPLPVARALEIAAQVCDALDAAHAHGVIHGDIKPENICLTHGGQVKVLDFGIARLMARAGGEHQQTLTTDSAVPESFAGTPRYAAPELFSGAAPDPRSDVYAAGAVLFEMLTGVPPHTGANAFEIGLKALGETPPRVDALRPDVPAAVADAVARALALDRSQRPGSAASMAASLRALSTIGDGTGDAPTLTIAGVADARGWPTPSPASTTARGLLSTIVTTPPRRRLAAAAALVIVLGALAWGGWRWSQPPAPASVGGAGQVLAILPLESTGDDRRAAAIGVGIADTLVADLASAPGLVVVSRRAAAALVLERREPTRLARDLGATLLVDGTVQALGDALRVTLTLVRPDGSVAWGRSVDGRASRLFDLQRELAASLRGALRVDAPAADGASAGRPQGPATVDVDALSDYSDALDRLARVDLAGNAELAIEGFTRALARDPGFALAHVGLSDAWMATFRQTRSGDALAKAREHADRAAALAPSHAETWVALGRLQAETGRQQDAVAALDRAIALQPSNDEAWRELAVVRAALGRPADAEQAFHRAIALRPAYWPNHHEYGRFLFDAGKLDAAAGEFRKVIECQPDSPRGYQALGTVLQVQGRLAEAIANYERATELSPSVNAHLNLGVLHHWAGRFREAIAAYERAAALAPEDPVPPRNVGDSLLRLGDHAGARTAYARALGLTEREVRRNPGAADMRELHAVLLAKLGRFAEAERESSALVSAAPDAASSQYAHAVVLALAGRPDAARAALDRALAHGYPRELAERDDDLAAMSGNAGVPGERTGKEEPR